MPLEKLIEGFKTFRSSYFEDNDHYKELVRNGQSPEALVIACSDSRNDPALLTSSEPGDIFVVRNVAAIVPPYKPDSQHHGTSAAIEFAVRGLKVKNIIVIGHALCGGVKALSEETGNNSDNGFEFLSPWISIGAPARAAVEEHLGDAPEALKLQALEQAVILTSLNNLMTFPWIKKGVEKGEIALHGWYFDMVHGKLLAYDFNSGTFGEVADDALGFSHNLKQSAKAGTPCCTEWPLEKLVKSQA